MNGDLLSTLPSDKSELTYREKTMLDVLYPDEATDPNPSPSPSSSIDVVKIEKTIENLPKESKKLWGSFKEVIISTILFVILNLPVVDTMISNIYKTDKPYYRLAMKSIIFAVAFFVLTNFSLARVN